MGLRPTANVPDKVLAGKLQCESAEYFGVLATTMTSQRVSIRSAAPSASVWPQFKGGDFDTRILEGWGSVRELWDLYQS